MAIKNSKSTGTGHTAGIFADMTLDGPEIGTLVVVVDRAKNLPNRKTMGKQDPYCAMRLGKEAKKTDTDRRGGQTPKWDQELRFTVHESPDYYKLKLSVFNDDKRTDLIGEAFISLADLIKPGGGSNDLWHQLSYKGKYAGDVRMEMSYYDMRPKEEKSTEKKRYREKTQERDVSTGPTGTSGPRQLGPREIRRRPLPANPGQSRQIDAPDTNHVHTEGQIAFDHPVQPQLQPRQISEPYLPSQSSRNINTGLTKETEYVQEPLVLYEPQNMTHGFQQASINTDHDFDANQFTTEPHEPLGIIDQIPRRQSYVPVSCEDEIVPLDAHMNLDSASADDCDSNLSHLNHIQYTPEGRRLNEPITQPHLFPEEMIDPVGLDERPPPPPKHSITPRRTQPEYPPSSYAPRPLRPIPIRPVVEERSPLQNIERTFDPQLHSASETSLVPHYPPQDDYSQIPRGLSQPERRRSFQPPHPPASVAAESLPRVENEEEYVQSLAQTSNHWRPPVPLPSQGILNHSGRFSRRSSYIPPEDDSRSAHLPQMTGRSRSYDDQLSHNPEQNTDVMYNEVTHAQSVPTLPYVPDEPSMRQSRPRNHAAAQLPARKAVSPGPYPQDAGRRLSGLPFGPDSYDVLNPASSPVTNENTRYETPEQARISARLRESREAESLGPIIGNDGREIDPSDHLPENTWAPEPERKQRKPEHVIHFRTKHDPRPGGSNGSSPNAVRMSMYKTLPNSPHMGSPNSAPPSIGRNRLSQQSQVANRPLPPQPYQKPHPRDSRRPEHSTQKSYQRNSFNEASPGLHRPALSEYQVPVHINYNARGSSHSEFQRTPPKIPMMAGRSTTEYHDPLAAEMSMIDIGPPRGNRSIGRVGRGY